ncbi:unnamed protein product [Urochloa humidicola]
MGLKPYLTKYQIQHYIVLTTLFAMQHYMNMIQCSKSSLSRRVFQAYSLLWSTRDLQLFSLDTSLSNQVLVLRQYHTRIIHNYTRNLHHARGYGLHLKMQLLTMAAYGQFQDHIKMV